MKRTNTRHLAMAALCVALGVILPQFCHSIPNAGSVLLPMHIPVLLCGLCCGWPYGLACGLLTPLLSSLIAAMLIGRGVYGAVNALVFRAGAYSMEIFLTAAFVTALPGIIIQLVILPALVLILEKVRVLESPYAVTV